MKYVYIFYFVLINLNSIYSSIIQNNNYKYNYGYNLSYYEDETNKTQNNVVQDKLEFTGETKIIIERVTDVIIIFLLISIVIQFILIIISVIYANKCNKNDKINDVGYSNIISKIFRKNRIEDLINEDIDLILNKFGYENINLNGSKLYYILSIDDYDTVFDELIMSISKNGGLINKYTFKKKWDNIKDNIKPHTNHDLYEINKRKLEAEISVGVLSAIIMGFSISVYNVETYKNYTYIVYNILNYFHVFIKSIVSGLAMLNVISSTTIYFQGMKMISRRNKSNYVMLEDFNKWWNKIKKPRKIIRYCFIYSLPLFLISFITNPAIWINNIFLAIFNLVIIYIAVIFGSITYCKLNFTPNII